MLCLEQIQRFTMVEIKITIGPDAFASGNFIYVWLKSSPNHEPFYVGETSKSVADRVGLHIRKSGNVARSGAVVGTLIHNGKWPTQEYTVLAIEVSNQVLCDVANENNAGCSNADKNRARKAIEYAVHQQLLKTYDKMHKPKGSKWRASSASVFCAHIIERCNDHVSNKA